MSIKKEVKQKLIKEYGVKEKDTGSVEVQCAILTQRINSLTEHSTQNKKDHSARRGLLMLVARRRKLLHYLRSKSEERYQALVKKLGLKK